MKKQSISKTEMAEIEKLQALSSSVGDFIRYWGFRRIHGQIWTQVFLSRKSLSGAELTERLGVSKALISPALVELEEYGLIVMCLDGGKTKRYSAVPDVIGVIKKILLNRETKIIEESKDNFEALNKVHLQRGTGSSALDNQKMKDLGKMISLAQVALGFLVGQNEDALNDLWTNELMSLPDHGE